MSNWWHNEYIFSNGEKQTPTSYLKDNYMMFTDAQLASSLSDVTNRNVTRNAIKKRRYVLGLVKGDAGVNQSTIKREPVQEKEQEINETDNYIDVSTTENKPLTKGDVIRMWAIDTNIWEIDSFKVNSWQVGAKAETKDLHYDDGKVSGSLRSDGLTIKTLYQTKCTFVRKNPISIEPTVHPVVCDREFKNDALVFCNRDLVTEMVISDPHFGYKRKEMYNDELVSFHDEDVLKIFVKVCELVQPDVIRVEGDIFDFPEFSDKFIRSPEFAFLTQPAINAAHGFFLTLRKTCPQSKIILNDGNHDKRLSDMIIKHLPFAYGLRAADELSLPPALSVPKLLALHKLNIEYTDSYPNDYSISDNGLVEYSHGEVARSKPYATVGAVVGNSDVSKCVGHIHRIESAYRTMWRGNEQRVIKAHSFGCACKTTGEVPGRTKRQNWQNGFGVIYHTQEQSSVTSYQIENGICLTPWGIIKS